MYRRHSIGVKRKRRFLEEGTRRICVPCVVGLPMTRTSSPMRWPTYKCTFQGPPQNQSYGKCLAQDREALFGASICYYVD